ncbi:hypothetical protein ACWPKO_01755 [Coraliomargarita sp. W4R53]
MLEISLSYKVGMIPSGCCGVAGFFGCEKEHCDFSIQIGELAFFPLVGESTYDVLTAATDHSCRHQTHYAAQRSALCPAEILFNALN